MCSGVGRTYHSEDTRPGTRPFRYFRGVNVALPKLDLTDMTSTASVGALNKVGPSDVMSRWPICTIRYWPADVVTVATITRTRGEGAVLRGRHRDISRPRQPG